MTQNNQYGLAALLAMVLLVGLSPVASAAPPADDFNPDCRFNELRYGSSIKFLSSVDCETVDAECYFNNVQAVREDPTVLSGQSPGTWGMGGTCTHSHGDEAFACDATLIYEVFQYDYEASDLYVHGCRLVDAGEYLDLIPDIPQCLPVYDICLNESVRTAGMDSRTCYGPPSQTPVFTWSPPQVCSENEADSSGYEYSCVGTHGANPTHPDQNMELCSRSKDGEPTCLGIYDHSLEWEHRSEGLLLYCSEE